MKNQSTADKKFLGMLAASRRPLLHDVPTTPEGLLKDLAELAAMRPWIYLGIVGADAESRRIRYIVAGQRQLTEKVITEKLAEVGGALGLIGLTAFKNVKGHTLQRFYRPLKKGTRTIEKLDKAGRALEAQVLETLEASEAV